MRREFKALTVLLLFTVALAIVAVIVVHNAGAEAIPPVTGLHW